MSLDANAVRITEAYARALAVAGRKDEAEAALKDFLARFPDNSLALVALEDIRAGPRACRDGGQSGRRRGRGACRDRRGDRAGGRDRGRLPLSALALHLDPNIAGGLAALSLGNLLEASNQGEAAIEAYELIPEDAPFRALGQMRAALALDSMDRTAEAEEAFKEAIGANPDDIQSYISYGNMLRGRERFAEAADDLFAGDRPHRRRRRRPTGASSTIAASATSAPRNGRRRRRISRRRWSSAPTSRWC